jgi:hypothetical protein
MPDEPSLHLSPPQFSSNSTKVDFLSNPRSCRKESARHEGQKSLPQHEHVKYSSNILVRQISHDRRSPSSVLRTAGSSANNSAAHYHGAFVMLKNSVHHISGTF